MLAGEQSVRHFDLRWPQAELNPGAQGRIEYPSEGIEEIGRVL